MKIDIDIQMPILANGTGGLSGRAIKPIGIRVVFDLFKNLKIPIIGCGGIFTWEDAVEYFLAGASAIQIGTALTEGYEIYKNLKIGVENYLRYHSFEEIGEIVGLAVNKFEYK